MQALDQPSSGCLLNGPGARARLRERIEDLVCEGGGKEVPAEERERMLAIVDAEERSPESIRDACSTRLMECFKPDRSRTCFGLLYELNSPHLLTQVASRLRRYASKADPMDVLQEVFFNVYRYPHRFNSAREDAFRVWTAMIVRNTVLKHLRSQGRGGRQEVPFEDLSDQPEVVNTNPLQGAIERESHDECARVYLTYLQLYLRFYSMLSDRERRALHLVEVEGQSYRIAAADLGIKLENLKMVIFRARRKIHRAMRRVFDGLPPDCRPARDPRPARDQSNPERVSADRVSADGVSADGVSADGVSADGVSADWAPAGLAATGRPENRAATLRTGTCPGDAVAPPGGEAEA
jgi:RNA polymerase sigma factor (sigma-70 family)